MATQAAVTVSGEWVPNVSFGDRLRVVRRGKRRTQEEMAALLGVKKVTYGTWEAGTATPSHDDIMQIAKRLYMLDRVPMWWTLGATDGPDLRPGTDFSTGSVAGRGARSSTDRASDYGSEFREFSPQHWRPSRGRERRRHLSVVPLYLEGGPQAATA